MVATTPTPSPVATPVAVRAPAPRPPQPRHGLIVLGVAAVLTLGTGPLDAGPGALTPQEAAAQPKQFGLRAYSDVFDQIDMALLVLNSALVTGLIAVGQMFTAALAGYVFARMEFRGAACCSRSSWPR